MWLEEPRGNEWVECLPQVLQQHRMDKVIDEVHHLNLKLYKQSQIMGNVESISIHFTVAKSLLVFICTRMHIKHETMRKPHLKRTAKY